MTNRRRGWSSQLVGGLVLGMAVIAAQPAAAQSTIFNIPTTDTLSAKKGYFEFDYLAQLPAPDAGQFQIFAPRLVVGLTPQLEAGVNVAVAHYGDDGGNFTLYQPNFKYKFYANDDTGVAASAGVIGYFADNDGDNFGQIYGVVSKKITDGPRFTFGAYGAVSCDACDGGANKGGVILGYEQPITGTVSFVADFLSGKNFWGYLTPGISVVLPRSGLLNIGYAIGYNELTGDGDPDYRNNALFVYYGITFP
ncbi:MAG: hypothetical protein ABL986_20545 [Vicinamibacterales bacterium]